MSSILFCKIRQCSTCFSIISERVKSVILSCKEQSPFCYLYQEIYVLLMWLCVRETDRHRDEIETNWVFSLEVFSFSSYKRCSDQRIHREAFLPLHLALHSFAKQSLRRRATRPPGQNSPYCEWSAFLPWQVTSLAQVSQKHLIPGIHPALKLEGRF